MSRTRMPDLRGQANAPTDLLEARFGAFRARMLDAAKRSVEWFPDITHGSVTGRGPDGKTYTAFAKIEAPGYVSAWLREGAGVEPLQEERDRTYVALERLELARVKWADRRRKREEDPRIFGRDER